MEPKTQKPQQSELFDNFGRAKENCQGCNQILPSGTRKIENYLFCGKCREVYQKKDKVRFLVIPQLSPPFFAARFNLIQFEAKMQFFELPFKIYTKDGITWHDTQNVFIQPYLR